MSHLVTTITIIIALACAIESTALCTADATGGDPGGQQTIPPPCSN